MAWYDSLLEQGYVPTGAVPKAVIEPGGEPGYYQTDRWSSALRALDKLQKEQQLKQQENQKKLNDKIDMYKTLREAGYDTKRAYEAVNNSKFPQEPGGAVKSDYEVEKIQSDISKADLDVKKTEAEIKKIEVETQQIPVKNAPKLKDRILQKIANGEGLTHGEQKIYDETMKGKDSDYAIPTRERILKKIADGEALTEGEQLLYDEVFSKTGDFDSILGTSPAVKPEKSEYVPMLRPDGTPTKVHKDDVTKAIKKGYKRR